MTISHGAFLWHVYAFSTFNLSKHWDFFPSLFSFHLFLPRILMCIELIANQTMFKFLRKTYKSLNFAMYSLAFSSFDRCLQVMLTHTIAPRARWRHGKLSNVMRSMLLTRHHRNHLIRFFVFF